MPAEEIASTPEGRLVDQGMDALHSGTGQSVEQAVSPRQGAQTRIARVAALLVVLAISASIVVFRDQLVHLATYGYAGLFVLGAVGSATVILPAPGLALAFAMGSTLNPLLVGLSYGSGAAIGELTGYLAGFSGRGIVENQAFYERVAGWMKRYGVLVIFVMSVIPNPLVDFAGITAGVLRIPVWQFLAASWAGQVIKATLVAFAGAGAINVLAPLVRAWLAR